MSITEDLESLALWIDDVVSDLEDLRGEVRRVRVRAEEMGL